MDMKTAIPYILVEAAVDIGGTFLLLPYKWRPRSKGRDGNVKRVIGTIPPASNLGLLKRFILIVNNAVPH